MSKFSWDEIRRIASSNETLLTKTGVHFRIVSVSEDTLTVKVSTEREHIILRKTLETAVTRIEAGLNLTGPKDYREYIADERPAYAWAILKHLGLFNA